MRAVGEGIEKQSRELVPSKVLAAANPCRKDQPLACHAALCGLAPQIVGALGAIFEKPQNAAGDSAQEQHPHIEYLGPDLVRIIETTKDKAFCRQAGVRA